MTYKLFMPEKKYFWLCCAKSRMKSFRQELRRRFSEVACEAGIAAGGFFYCCRRIALRSASVFGDGLAPNFAERIALHRSYTDSTSDTRPV